MAYCPHCGSPVDPSDNYCMACGRPLRSGPLPPLGAVPPPMWEYRTFSIPLDGATVRDTYVFRIDGGIPDSLQGEMTRLIEAAVERFLRYIAPQGWEPVEAITADALWRAGHVVTRDKQQQWSGRTTRQLISVSLTSGRQHTA